MYGRKYAKTIAKVCELHNTETSVILEFSKETGIFIHIALQSDSTAKNCIKI